jgi:hypothetical protein
MGAWVSYGLGAESRDLPGFVVLNGGLTPPGGIDNFGSGFLPATYQGSVLRPGAQPIANIAPSELRPDLQVRKLSLLKSLDAALDRIGKVDELESAIRNYELAFRMQSAVPELTDLSREPEHLKRSYGLDAAFGPTRTFGAECLIARRLVERGVRFVELTCPAVSGDRWDQHSNLRDGHTNNARAVDQPIGALLEDLKARGLLDETLVVWAGEFGRTPFAGIRWPGSRSVRLFDLAWAEASRRLRRRDGRVRLQGRRGQGVHSRPPRDDAPLARNRPQAVTVRFSGRDAPSRTSTAR